MSKNKTPLDSILSSSSPRVFSKWILAGSVGIGVALIFSIGTAYVWAGQFEGRLAPNIYVGPLSIGGLDPESAQEEVRTYLDNLLLNGIEVSTGSETNTIPLSSFGITDTDASYDYISFQVDEMIEMAQTVYRNKNAILDSLTLVIANIQKTQIPLGFTINEIALEKNLRETFTQNETQAKNARFAFSFADDAWTVETRPAQPGKVFRMDQFFSELETQFTSLEIQPIELVLEYQEPEIREASLAPLMPLALSLIQSAPYTLVYEPNRFTYHETVMQPEILASAIEPNLQGNTVTLTLSEDALLDFYDRFANRIEREAIDAQFQITEGRVSYFVPAREGVSLNREEISKQIIAGWENQENRIAVVVDIIKPNVTTSDVNELGIVEVLGVGTSDYSGSPGNRIKNIKNGVNLLNGILIKPDEEFSLINALKPFELNNGYLPELVIKGDKIIPEIAGGLCQIGTTTFRAAMNAGLDITMRQNHSLVVSYYNDPSNGNPGTDATLYDPAPYFRFINNTGNTLLFQAELDTDKSELLFTFWGKSDGRVGSYVPPTVTRWIPVGETKYIESEDLEPGEEQCQGAHIGADTEFIYTVENPDGTKDETTYTSHYRPLPRICLVGVEKKADDEKENAIQE